MMEFVNWDDYRNPILMGQFKIHGNHSPPTSHQLISKFRSDHPFQPTTSQNTSQPTYVEKACHVPNWCPPGGENAGENFRRSFSQLSGPVRRFTSCEESVRSSRPTLCASKRPGKLASRRRHMAMEGMGQKMTKRWGMDWMDWIWMDSKKLAIATSLTP